MTKPNLTDLEELAYEAGGILRLALAGDRQVYQKGVIDLVTDADHSSEDYLIKEISARFPGHTIVAEESGELPGEGSEVWYIDPMDGTVNFAHGIPLFCVAIGYAESGKTKLGVVYDPIREECFSGELGRGARLNGEPMRATAQHNLDQSLLATEFGYDVRTHPENNLDHYAYFALHSLGVRRIGSAALDLCYVACGRFDGYWELRVKPWDLAAGGLIAQEAGARVTKIDGDTDYVTPPCSVLAAGEGIYPEMWEILRR